MKTNARGNLGLALSVCMIVWVYIAINYLNNSKFIVSTASQQALRHGLSLEVDRLGELLDKLENKVFLIDKKVI